MWAAALNIIKRERIEGPLVLLIEKAYETIRPHLRENGFIKNEDIRKILKVSVRQATRIASRLVAEGRLRSEGYLKMRCYFPVT
ncbi:MAG: hypothetical protein K0B01_12835 [Syntrophobacterales bacterium]|nr:hypothetical protein [Syntrophobacterales bacterium]